MLTLQTLILFAEEPTKTRGVFFLLHADDQDEYRQNYQYISTGSVI